MDKISEIRWKMASDLNIPYGEENSFFKGIDAAMELQLPVSFIMWLKDNYNLQNETGIWTNKVTGEWNIEPELYEDFQNIYQPSKP